ncbi:MAG: gamma-glutamylcyclotransferase [Bryobacteraceae bacterium]
MHDRLFVYGTLRENSQVPLTRLLPQAPRLLGAAYAHGRLFDLGSYPGMIPSPCRPDRVAGELYELAARSFLVLDRYEGPLFERRRIRVRMARNGRSVAAWCYLYRFPAPVWKRIRSGDYRAP